MENHKKQKSNILFVIPNLNGGGAERVFINYIRALDKQKYNISLALVEKIGPYLDLVPAYVNIIDFKKKRTRYSFFKLRKSINRVNPDLVVSTTNYMNMLLIFVSLITFKKITTCLYEPTMPSAQFREKHLPQYYCWLMKLIYRFSDYIIAQTEDMKIEIEQYYSSPKKKILVTINPIDTVLIAKQVANAKNPYDPKSINIIISGRISEEKGQVFLLKSFAKVVKENPKFKLHLIGKMTSESYMEKVERVIEENNLQNNVEFIEFQLNPFPYYKYADLLVLPSKWEGLPNVVLESLFLQTPVVVTDCIPYFYILIKQGKNGYVVKYGDENNMADKILKYHNLKVKKDFLNLPDYNEIFWQMIHS